MEYEIIEKNEYGVLVRKMKSIPTECEKCKYTGRAVTLQPCKSCKTDNSYYLPDQEAAKLESEKSFADEIINVQKDKINGLEGTFKQLWVFQKELLDLQIENKKLKDRIKELEGLLRREELKVNELKHYLEENIKDMSENGSSAMEISSKIILEFIKNQK